MFKFFKSKEYWRWSILGTLAIIGAIYADVQLDVLLNTWFGEFYDTIQKALTTKGSVSTNDLITKMFEFGYIAGISMILLSFLDFFVKHYTWRWRTSMNKYYTANIDKLRRIEGFSQRVQEDAHRLSRIVEDLGADFVRAVLTLAAFLPILWELSKKITHFPIVGEVSHGLVIAAILFAILGTVLVALVSRKLPGLEFQRQATEAAYRKELVLAEDDLERGKPKELRELYEEVRKNHFTIFKHYFNLDVVKWTYLQGGTLIPYILMSPSIAGGLITLGVVNRVGNAFNKVERSFQYLVRSYGQVIEAASIYKRLKEFELVLDDSKK